MDDREAHEFYKDPEHLRPAGPGRKRNGPRLTNMTAVRFAPETIEVVKGVAHREGITVGAWIRRLVGRAITAPAEPEMTEVTTDGFGEPFRVRTDLLRELASALLPALIKHGSVSLTLGAATPRPTGLIPGSGRVLPPRAIPSSLSLPRTFRCPHMSIGNVAGASCGTCGPMRPAA